MAKPVRAAPESLPGSGPVEANVGQRLRARREARGVSLREFARRLGLSPSAISKIETDKFRPSVSTLWSIVSELGMSLDELFAPASDRTPAPSASPPRCARWSGSSTWRRARRT